jgi:hypothetical protein
VTCHRFGLWRSHFLWASRKESGSAAKESGDKSPQSKCLTHHRVRYNRCIRWPDAEQLSSPLKSSVKTLRLPVRVLNRLIYRIRRDWCLPRPAVAAFDPVRILGER